ncbi:MAG TPA: STAS domain-containing protein [Thermoleophilaceae bacterium]|jgi:anti-anti-sigma factor|nr:STAS domain-containing protein [Thermoleophilaceae bacterium]
MTRLAQLKLEDDGGVTVATVEGEIDLSNAAGLEMAISNAVANQALGLVVDLASVDYLDSAGVTLLFNLARRVSRRQQQFMVVVPREAHVREILSLSGATDALALQDSLDDAMSQLDRSQLDR